MLSKLAIFPLLALAVGCAGVQLPKAVTADPPPIRKRNEENVRQFEQERDRAEYEAAKTRWLQQRDVQGCRDGLEKLLGRNPRHRDAQLLLAELLLAQDDAQGAYGHAKAALDAYPNDAQVQYAMGVVTDAMGQRSDALGYFQRAAKMDPHNDAFQAAYQAAQEAARQQVREDRSTTLGVVAETDSAGFAVAAGYAASADPVGQPGRPLHNERDPAGELLRKGQAALAAGSPQAAMDWFRQAVAARPASPEAPLSAAAAALKANRPEMAVELLAAAAKQFPTSVAIHRMLGVAYYRSGDYQSSQVALQQALLLDKSSAISYLLMGCTLAKLGQQQAAESNFRQASALDPRYTVVR
jgi:tetratricopeptide (TPR) repeat protein